jgi:curli biogenesis system outer membrane secretion channel CsgG
MSRRFISQSAAVAAVLLLCSACATTPEAHVSGGGGPTIAQAQAQKYDGPKARIAVVKFIDKTGKTGGSLGEGMADMLTTALFNANRYILLDRQDLNAVINEQDFAAAGRVSEKTAARMGNLEGAELLIFGAITGFEEDSLGAGGILLGAITLGASVAISASNNSDTPLGIMTYTESYIALDMKVVDAKTGRVVAASTVEGRTQNWGGGVVGGVGGGWSRAPVALGGWAGTGVENAARDCIDSAVKSLVKNTPPDYYRHSESADLTPMGLVVQPTPVSLPYADASGVPGPSAHVVDRQETYVKLLDSLDTPPGEAPVFDWRSTRLIAVFAGEKPVKGHRIGVERIVHRDGGLEVTIRQGAPSSPPPPATELAQKKKEAVAETAVIPKEADWPFEIVRIDNIGKPIKFIWAQ